MTSVAETLRAARAELQHVDATGREAERLLGLVLGVTRAQLIAWPERAVPEANRTHLTALLARRARGEPFAYLVGRREFWSLDLAVSPAVLVPRPETELLVEVALSLLTGRAQPRIADLGTGSGAIGLALASARPDALVELTDASPEALTVARANAEQLGLGHVTCRLGDWLAALGAPRYDLLVANPPYLAAHELAAGAATLAYEPERALVAGPTGLEALAAIITAAPARLAPGGALVLEHGATQGEAVRALLAQAGFVGIRAWRDLAGLERAAAGRTTG